MRFNAKDLEARILRRLKSLGGFTTTERIALVRAICESLEEMQQEQEELEERANEDAYNDAHSSDVYGSED